MTAALNRNTAGTWNDEAKAIAIQARVTVRRESSINLFAACNGIAADRGNPAGGL